MDKRKGQLTDVPVHLAFWIQTDWTEEHVDGDTEMGEGLKYHWWDAWVQPEEWKDHQKTVIIMRCALGVRIVYVMRVDEQAQDVNEQYRRELSEIHLNSEGEQPRVLKGKVPRWKGRGVSGKSWSVRSRDEEVHTRTQRT